MVEKIEEIHDAIFKCAQKNIAKAQIHQAKGYNNCQASGKPFEVGQKVLKINFKRGHLEKLRNKYVGPYTILYHDATGNRFFLKDWHSHFLKRNVHTGHLVKYNENQTTIWKIWQITE